ncbi:MULTISPECIES: L-threonylcarbamoyladenylate synthase [unclassified Desulfovibrio]|uniref:L-threonylcarbamoyladenylate synthase n=1 Tax=unclassified Desulfovibrio TaxID=2593640 RepID=UPI000F5E557C|nr:MULTISPECIES: Sua5/YciO/YrdC/YwlC family protein [unclassified Desulfovibrio]RRD69561.1 Sua5/YciO/YrdC/YwlC family protein [Desulfovibrio sp. OH1209_COT-279]RRD86225.1 Sua5/YciO/YrdC/YwlC family protein [Desulfovibrio sp. OH1186_COT-070]
MPSVPVADCASAPAGGSAHLSLEEAALCLRRGGVLVFPTETLYALGCLATDSRAVERVYQIKRRSVHKPLPLLAADAEQAGAVVHLAALPPELAAFWPGPLSVLLPALPSLPLPLRNARGLAALRVTSHPQAAALARAAGCPLTASSANFRDAAPACLLQDLDTDLLDALTAASPLPGRCPLLSGHPQPAGGKPSTLVEPLPKKPGGQKALRVLRPGAVPEKALEDAGFFLVR